MAPIDNPLEVFFDLVPTGAALYAPVHDGRGELVDFRFVRLNPAGQRLLGLPAQPPHSFREYYPHSVPTGIFAHYCAAYSTGQASTYDVPYAGDGLDTFFRLVAQRAGGQLHRYGRPAAFNWGGGSARGASRRTSGPRRS